MVWQRGLLFALTFCGLSTWHGPGLFPKICGSHRHSLTQEELTWSCKSAICTTTLECHQPSEIVYLQSPRSGPLLCIWPHHSRLTTYGQGKDFLLVALFTRVLRPHNFNGIALIGFKKVKAEMYLNLFLKLNSREVKEVKRIRDISSKLQLLGWPRKFFGFSPEVLTENHEETFSANPRVLWEW